MKRFLLSFVAVLVLAFTAAAPGATFDDRIPSDALLYVGWAGADALTPQYNASNLKAILDASAVKDFASQQLPELIHKATGNDARAAQVIAQLQKGLGIAWQHPTAFYFCPFEFNDRNRPPVFRFGLICDAGTDAQPLADLLNETLVKNAPPDLAIHASLENNVVLLTFGRADSFADLKQGGVLSEAPAYMKAMAQVKQPGQALAVYGDVQKFLALVADTMAKSGAPVDFQARFDRALDSLGLKSITQFALLSGFDKKGWAEKFFIGVDGPHVGILALVDTTPLSDGALALVPKDAASFTAGKMDLHKVYTEALSIVGKIDDSTAQELNAGVARLNQMLTLNVETDLIAPLGDEWVMYRAPGANGSLTFTAVNKLKDGPAFAKALAALEQFFNANSGMPFKIEKMKSGTADVSLLAFAMYNVAWTVKDGYLYVSTLDGMSTAIAQVENKLPSIATNDLYKQAMAALPANVKPTSIAYAHPARIYPQLRSIVLGLLPLARAQGLNIPMDILPDPAQTAEFMPGAAVAWFDAAGVHAMGTAAFPGAELLGGQLRASTGLAVAAGGAVLAPMFARAQMRPQPAPMVQPGQPRIVRGGPMPNSANLRALSMGCIVWANENKGQLPDNVARLLSDNVVQPENLVNRSTGRQPLVMTPALEDLAKTSFDKFAAQVDAHCDYVYLGKGLKLDSTAKVALLYEKAVPGAPGMNVGFHDGHVEFVPWQSLDEALRSTNDYLVKHNLPPVDVKALQQQGNRGGAGNPANPGLP